MQVFQRLHQQQLHQFSHRDGKKQLQHRQRKNATDVDVFTFLQLEQRALFELACSSSAVALVESA